MILAVQPQPNELRLQNGLPILVLLDERPLLRTNRERLERTRHDSKRETMRETMRDSMRNVPHRE